MGGIAEMAAKFEAALGSGDFAGMTELIKVGIFVLAALHKGTMIGSCGCFGREETPPHWTHVLLNAGLAGLAALTAVRSPGAVLDALLDEPATAVGVVALSAVALYLLYAAFVELPRTLTAGRPQRA